MDCMALYKWIQWLYFHGLGGSATMEYSIQNVNSALIENKYLYHYLKYKEKEMMNLRIGTGLPNIQKKDLENFTILVPSLLIQRKNLALFEMLDEKISILTEELTNLQKQKKYLLCNMFI